LGAGQFGPTDFGTYKAAVNVITPEQQQIIYDPSYDSGMLSTSGSWGNDPIGTSHGRGRLGDTGQSVELRGVNDNNAKNLQACDGKCNRDGKYAAGLKCYQRANNEKIPGCNNNAAAAAHWDYCYDPNLAAWSTQANDQNQWWQIDVSASMATAGTTVVGAAVRGRAAPNCDQYITKWKFQYWDGAVWQWVDNGAEFNGTPTEADCNNRVDILFNAPIATSKIRFRPWVWNLHASARMALLVFQPAVEETLCVKCPAGKIANANDQASCQTLCAVGDYLSGSSCVAMTVQTCTHGESFSSASRYVKSDVTMLVVLLVVV